MLSPPLSFTLIAAAVDGEHLFCRLVAEVQYSVDQRELCLIAMAHVVRCDEDGLSEQIWVPITDCENLQLLAYQRTARSLFHCSHFYPTQRMVLAFREDHNPITPLGGNGRFAVNVHLCVMVQ